MVGTSSLADRRAFYAAALAGLRFVEARRPTGRRFGAEADARWAGFRGDLTTADRLDLLLRDADAEWAGAFGARTTFADPAAAEDESFGLAWPGLDPLDAEEVWRTTLAGTEPKDPSALFSAWSAAWSLSLSRMDLGPVSTVDRLIVAGPSALVAMIAAFVGRSDLAWNEQVTVVATPPAHRQLAYFATAVLKATRPAIILTHDETANVSSLAGTKIISADASAEDASAARRSTS